MCTFHFDSNYFAQPGELNPHYARNSLTSESLLSHRNRHR